MSIKVFSVLLATVLVSAPANAKVVSKATSVSFENCLATIRGVSARLGVAPVNLVETNIMRMVRFPTSDGSVLVTCSRPDRKQIVTMSSNRE